MGKQVTIYIKGNPFTYYSEDGDFNWASLKAISEKDAIETLTTAKRLLDEIGIEFCLAFGTLLGAVREKSIIKGDQDVDVFLTQEEKLYENLPWLYERGFKIIRIRKGILYSFRVNNNCFIDLYILRPLGFSIWSLYCYSLVGNAIPKKYVRKTQDIEFLGSTYKCPKNPERVLEWWYGKDWRIPKSSKGHYEVNSRAFWKKIKYHLRKRK